MVNTVGVVTAANVAAGCQTSPMARIIEYRESIVKCDYLDRHVSGSSLSPGTLTFLRRIQTAAGVINQNGSRSIHSFGSGNFFAGPTAGNFTMTGSGNVGLGFNALAFTTSGSNNVAAGVRAMEAVNTGTSNVALGANALRNLTSGGGNIAIGESAGNAITTTSGNILIGQNGVAGDTNTTRIGSGGKTFIGGIRGVTTVVPNAIPVLIDGLGQLGTVSSSRRYKEDIADMGEASSRLRALRPVVFHYKQPYANGEKPTQYGLIAEEVAETFPELAVFNDEGKPETVKYQDITPLLLNEFLKERQRSTAAETVLREENANMRKRLAELEANLARLEQRE